MPIDHSNPDSPNQPEHLGTTEHRSNHGLFIWGGLACGLAVIALVTFAYAQHERQRTDDLTAANQTLNSSLTQMQQQLQSVTERLNQRVEAETKAAEGRTATSASGSPRAAGTKATPRNAAVRDPRVDQLRSDLKEQQQALASTRDDLDKARTDLQGRLDSSRDELTDSLGRTKDELNTSIAHTHDELVTMQKRGAKNYFEFALNRSKQFQKVGPVSLELRKVDYKHKSFDLDMIVDDFTLQKRKVNLFEPVWINLVDAPEPAQLVVNQIDKDKITGYIAAPKYRKAEVEPQAQTASVQQ